MLLILVAAVTLQPLRGPYATAAAACADAPLEYRTDHSAFCRRLGAWQVTLRDGDQWFIGSLPLQNGVTPRGVSGDTAPYRVRFAQHAFSTAGIDDDGEWIWPCLANACASEAVPVEMISRSHETEVVIGGDVTCEGGHIDVVFHKLRIIGQSARAREWRALIERLRGHHDL